MMRQFAAVAICLASMFPHYSSCAQPLSREDSLRILRWAQHAQWDFERHRRFALPPMYTSTGAPCDLIGRFCVRHGGIVFERIPAMDLSASRENLMHVLDTAATLLPGDDWIAGQRVRYLVDAGDGNSALRAARACRGTSWWCEALEGMALHVVGDFEGAEQAFAKALASMPAKKRWRSTPASPPRMWTRCSSRRRSCVNSQPMSEQRRTCPPTGSTTAPRATSTRRAPARSSCPGLPAAARRCRPAAT